MTSLRAVLILALVATACAAPRHHQRAVFGSSVGRSHHEEVELESAGAVSTAASEEAESPPDVDVSVSKSTSVEITTMTSSVSSEMSLMPDQMPPEGSEASEEEASMTEEEKTQAAGEKAQVSQEGAGPTEQEKAAEQAAGLESDVTSNEIEDSSADLLQSADESVALEVEDAAKEASEPTTVPQKVDVATSVSMEMTETMVSVSSETGAPEEEEEEEEEEEASGDGAVNLDDFSDGVYSIDTALSLELSEEDEEGSGIEADVDGSGRRIEADFDSPKNDASSGDREEDEAESSGDNTTKGTLIFDLGTNASDELHDLVQQTVLEALMDEGLLSATEGSPSIQAEGSGIVFLDGSGSGDGAEDDAGDGAPFVSIHF